MVITAPLAPLWQDAQVFSPGAPVLAKGGVLLYDRSSKGVRATTKATKSHAARFFLKEVLMISFLSRG
jgi:hypothetical protein